MGIAWVGDMLMCGSTNILRLQVNKMTITTNLLSMGQELNWIKKGLEKNCNWILNENTKIYRIVLRKSEEELQRCRITLYISKICT